MGFVEELPKAGFKIIFVEEVDGKLQDVDSVAGIAEQDKPGRCAPGEKANNARV